MAVDEAGRTFYRNDATNARQWERPRWEAGMAPPFRQGTRGNSDGEDLLLLVQDFAREDAERGRSATRSVNKSAAAASDYIRWRDRAGRGEPSAWRSWRERAAREQTADWERCLDLDRRQFERERSVTSLYLHDKSAWIDRIDRLDRLGERARER